MASTTQVKDRSYFIKKIFSNIDAAISVNSWVQNRGVSIAKMNPCISDWSSQVESVTQVASAVAHTKLFFSVTMNHIKYPCALIHWYSLVGDSPDENMGMWVV